MSISCDVTIKRDKALKAILNKELERHKEMLIKALNASNNSELASYLHTDTEFYHIEGKGILLQKWEEE